MKSSLRTGHELFQRLKNDPPLWWQNLKSDPELYIDIRKDNYINVYHNGGCIMKLSWKNDYKAEIHIEYIPLKKVKEYWPFEFKNRDISLKKIQTFEINNFKKEPLQRIKNRIKKFYPNDSEKGIQGRYVVKVRNKLKNDGFFIDTEIQYGENRIDMVWVDLRIKKIAFVELKKISDGRLYIDNNQDKENISTQLKKYYKFASKNKTGLIEYYNRVFCIKNELGLLPKYVKENSLENFKLIEKPILLVGDCTQNWIDNYAKKTLNKQLQGIAFGCVYHGKTTWNFRIPSKTVGNYFKLD